MAEEEGERTDTAFSAWQTVREQTGNMVCVRLYADLRKETWALFETLDEALWLSPPVPPPRGINSRSFGLCRAGLSRRTRVSGRPDITRIWLKPLSS